jgi:hypothetical protein
MSIHWTRWGRHGLDYGRRDFVEALKCVFHKNQDGTL